jgi:integrase
MPESSTPEAGADERPRRRDRGAGSIFKPKFRDNKTGEMRECPHFRISYYRHGQRFVENTHSDKITVAKELLKKKLGQIAIGNFAPPRTEKILVEELMNELLRDSRVRGISILESDSGDPDIAYIQEKAERRLKFTKRRWENHLQPFFAHVRASRVSTDDINRYIEKRQQEKANNATINREIALLKRAFNFGTECTPTKVRDVPVFPKKLKENPPREGFVDEAQYKRLCDNCSEPWLRALMATAYAFGFREGELVSMRVRQVDLCEKTIRLRSLTTKNEESRVVKMTQDVYQLMAISVSGKAPLDYVFTRNNGKHVRDFRSTWIRLTEAAKLTGLLLHDFRRSAVRNMIRRGVPQVVAMKISGHKTMEVFNRYNIVDEADLADAARRIENGRDNSLSTAQVVKAENTGSEADQQPIH